MRHKRKTILRYAALAGLLGVFIWALACGGGGGGSGGGSSSGWSTADYQYLNLHNASYLDGFTVRWPNVPIGVSAPEFPEARAAFERWTSASGGKVRFAFGGGNITVSYDSNMSYCGLARVTYTASGQIVSATITIHPDQSRCYNGLENTLTHEAAHAIGFFGHDASGTIMSPTGNGPITSQQGTFFNMLYSMSPGTDISGFLGKTRMASSTKFNKSGGRLYTLVIPRRWSWAK